jgi:guanylate kinase
LSEQDAGREPSLIVITAPSGTGKSTVLARVLREVEELRFSVSHTTRAPRSGETDGVEYHFVDERAFDALVSGGRMLEWARVHGHRSGTSWAELERARLDGVDLLLDLDVQGAAQVRGRALDAVTLFILPPSFADLERRLRLRATDSAEAIARRLADARAELRRWDEFDYVVVNDDLGRCVADVKTVIGAARLRRSRMEPVARRTLASLQEAEAH